MHLVMFEYADEALQHGEGLFDVVTDLSGLWFAGVLFNTAFKGYHPTACVVFVGGLRHST